MRDNAGLIKADQFISFAEESGIIYQLNLWTIEQAIEMLAKFKKNGLSQTLSVNISNREVFQSQLVESVVALLEKHEVEPGKLILEIKESAFAENLNRALKVARLLSQAGIKVAIDDFGKDSMAIGTFNHFDPHYRKVDCRNLSKIQKADALSTYTNAIIGMAQTLKIDVIAQGVESENTERQLHDLECKIGQGFLYSKPFELSGFMVWMEQWHRSQMSTSSE
jgi:diguanylate cyclase